MDLMYFLKSCFASKGGKASLLCCLRGGMTSLLDRQLFGVIPEPSVPNKLLLIKPFIVSTLCYVPLDIG